MKIFAVGDLHLDWSTHGVDRFDEIERSLNEVVARAEEARADLFVFAGDLCNPDSGPCVFRAVACAIRVMTRLSLAGMGQVWIAGNHDVIEDGRGETTLAPLAAMNMRGVVVAQEPISMVFRDRLVLALPFISATAPRTEERELQATGAIAISHATYIDGARLSDESTDLARGRATQYPYAATRGAAVRINGHYHHAQTVNAADGGADIIIPGSLARLTFGEGKNEPGYVVVEV